MLEKPKPMTFREAVEAVNIIKPHIATLRSVGTGMQLAQRMLHGLSDDHPSQPFRLLSLMYHMTMEDLAAALEPEGGAGVVLVLLQGMLVNPIPDLVNFGKIMGLTEEAWNA